MRILILLAIMFLIAAQRDGEGAPLVDTQHGLIVVLALVVVLVISEAVDVVRAN